MISSVGRVWIFSGTSQCTCPCVLMKLFQHSFEKLLLAATHMATSRIISEKAEEERRIEEEKRLERERIALEMQQKEHEIQLLKEQTEKEKEQMVSLCIIKHALRHSSPTRFKG